MKQVEISINERILAAVVVGQHRGRLADARVLSRVLDKLQLADDEKAAIGMEEFPAEDGVGVRWNPAKAAAQPPVVLSLENDEAAKLLSCLSNWEGYTPADAKRIGRVVEQLQRQGD